MDGFIKTKNQVHINFKFQIFYADRWIIQFFFNRIKIKVLRLTKLRTISSNYK